MSAETLLLAYAALVAAMLALGGGVLLLATTFLLGCAKRDPHFKEPRREC